MQWKDLVSHPEKQYATTNFSCFRRNKKLLNAARSFHPW